MFLLSFTNGNCLGGNGAFNSMDEITRATQRVWQGHRIICILAEFMRHCGMKVLRIFVAPGKVGHQALDTTGHCAYLPGTGHHWAPPGTAFAYWTSTGTRPHQSSGTMHPWRPMGSTIAEHQEQSTRKHCATPGSRHQWAPPDITGY